MLPNHQSQAGETPLPSTLKVQFTAQDVVLEFMAILRPGLSNRIVQRGGLTHEDVAKLDGDSISVIQEALIKAHQERRLGSIIDNPKNVSKIGLLIETILNDNQNSVSYKTAVFLGCLEECARNLGKLRLAFQSATLKGNALQLAVSKLPSSKSSRRLKAKYLREAVRDYDNSIEYAEQARSGSRGTSRQSIQRIETLVPLTNLLKVYIKLGRSEKQRQTASAIEEIVSEHTPVVRPNDKYVVSAYHVLGLHCEKEGNLERAVELYERAIKVSEELSERTFYIGTLLGDSHLHLAGIQRVLGDNMKAAQHAKSALTLYSETKGSVSDRQVASWRMFTSSVKREKDALRRNLPEN